MEILQRIGEDLAINIKAKNHFKVMILRMMISSIHNKEISLRGQRLLTNSDVVDVLTSMIKQRYDSKDQFEKGGRLDLSERELNEIEIIMEYLPKQLCIEELRKIVEESIQELKISTVKELGKLMKHIVPKIKGKADNKIVSELAKEQLEKTNTEEKKD